MKLLAAALLVVLTGCAGASVDRQSLAPQGFRRAVQAEGPNYELWVKEVLGSERKVELCLVPSVVTRDYLWTAAVSVDGKAAWSSSVAQVQSFTPESRVDCATSSALGPGRLSYQVWFRYRPV